MGRVVFYWRDRFFWLSAGLDHHSRRSGQI